MHFFFLEKKNEFPSKLVERMIKLGGGGVGGGGDAVIFSGISPMFCLTKATFIPTQSRKETKRRLSSESPDV